MRSIRVVLALLFPLLASCGAKPDAAPQAKPDTQPPAAAPAVAKPELIRAKWKVEKTPAGAKAINWGEGFDYKDWQDKFPILDLKRKDALAQISEKERWGPGAAYAWTDADTIEVKRTGPQTIGANAPKPKEYVRKFKVTIAGDKLTLTDEDGGAATFQRLAPVVGNVKITELAFCCDNCPEPLKAELAKAKGVSDVAVDVKNRTVTLKLADEDDWQVITHATAEAGMEGTLEVNGKRFFSNVALTIGGAPEPVKEIVFKKVHACCGGCKIAIQGCCPKGTTVTLEGDGPTKTLKLTGDALNQTEITSALSKAGFRAVAEPKR